MKVKFSEYQLSNEILKAIEILNFSEPTKVQQEVIPSALVESDIIVKSQTGSGKTAAFAIPICELLEWEENKPQALVLTPTRELAMQVKEDFFNIGRFKRIKVSAIYGKSPFNRQEKELKQKTHVVVGTPGRTIDHLERGTLDTSEVRYLVIDEADEMLNMGFIEQLRKIINKIPNERVTMVFSATMPSEIQDLCRKYMKNEPVLVEIEKENLTGEKILQKRFMVDEADKPQLLKDVTLVENPDSCIVFCNTKQQVDEVFKDLRRSSYTCEKLHGGMEQRDRERVMNDFKQGYFRYLIATDVAARGIDVHNISLVINYDLPNNNESYVHRIGRTGRKGLEGQAITFATKRDRKQLKDIQNYIDKEIELRDKPSNEMIAQGKEAFDKKMRTAPKPKMAKGENLNKEILKLHINAGKKTKMRAVDIVGTLCNLEGITKDDIGIINILDISTYVEILNNKGDRVYKLLQNTPIKGRIRKVSKADR